MPFLLSALGSAGDVHPFIAIGQVLVARGHAVRLLASPVFEARIRLAGLGFTPLGTVADYEALLREPALWHARRGTKLVLEELLQRLPEALRVTVAAADDLDAQAGPGTRTVLVGSSLSWAVRLLQESSGRPAVSVHLAPSLLLSAQQPPVLPGLRGLARLPLAWRGPLLRFGEWALLDRWIAPRLNGLRAALGLPPVRRVVSTWMHSPGLVIGAWPEWFAPTPDDVLPQLRCSGFPLFHEPAASDGPPLPEPLQAFLAAGLAPVGVTPGSAMAHSRRFFSDALAGCAALGARAVLVTPYRDQLPATLPPWALHLPYAPFSTLLPQLAGLVHHGGIGTSAQALAAGLPQLVLPFAHDQFDNAARLQRLGVARTLSAHASVERWTTALRHLHPGQAVAGSSLRGTAATLAARMAADGPGAERIADLLEPLQAGSVPLTR
jgi:rhamnosyltransferase subunit B